MQFKLQFYRVVSSIQFGLFASTQHSTFPPVLYVAALLLRGKYINVVKIRIVL